MHFFFPLLDYGDLLFMNAPVQYLKRLDTIYHVLLLAVEIVYITVLCMLLLNGHLCTVYPQTFPLVGF